MARIFLVSVMLFFVSPYVAIYAYAQQDIESLSLENLVGFRTEYNQLFGRVHLTKYRKLNKIELRMNTNYSSGFGEDGLPMSGGSSVGERRITVTDLKLIKSGETIVPHPVEFEHTLFYKRYLLIGESGNPVHLSSWCEKHYTNDCSNSALHAEIVEIWPLSQPDKKQFRLLFVTDTGIIQHSVLFLPVEEVHDHSLN